MTFLLPIGLLALLSLPIIILLHLIRERRRRVAVPSLLLWRDLPRTRAGERPRVLPLTLLLLLHLLVAGLLGLALARPQILSALGSRTEQVAIVLDLSTSMGARSGTGTRLDAARERARALLRGLPSGGRAALIGAGARARVLAVAGAGDLALLDAALAQAQPGGTGTAMDEALTLAAGALDPQRPGTIVVLTDGSLPPPTPRGLPVEVEWQSVGANEANRAVVSFAVRPLGATLQVYARIANYDSLGYRGQARLYADEQLIDTRDLTIDGEHESEQTWRISSGPATLRLELDGRDALAADDVARLNVAGPRALRVVLVSAEPDTLKRALQAVPGVTVEVLDPQTYAGAGVQQRAADLTVLDGTMPQELPQSALLAINPPPGNGLLQVADTTRAVSNVALTAHSDLLAGLSFGGVDFGPAPVVTAPAWAETLLEADGLPLILRGHDGARAVGVWAFNPDQGNLHTRLAFPLLVARTVRDLAPGPLPDALLAGATLTLHPSARASTVQITTPERQTFSRPVSPTLTLDELTQPGWYRVVEQGSGGTLFDGQLAVNAGSPLESDLRPQAPPQLNGPADAASGQPLRRTFELWPGLALLALLVLSLEWLYTHR